jgi:hypothetical protein
MKDEKSPVTGASCQGFPYLGETRNPGAAKTVPEAVETFRRRALLCRDHVAKPSPADQRKKCKFAATRRIHEGSGTAIANWFLSRETEGLLQAIRTAFSLVRASNRLGDNERGPDQVESEAIHRGRGFPVDGNLPGSPARARSQQTSRKARPRSRSCGSRSREVAVYEYRPDDRHGFASALRTLITPPRNLIRPQNSSEGSFREGTFWHLTTQVGSGHVRPLETL